MKRNSVFCFGFSLKIAIFVLKACNTGEEKKTSELFWLNDHFAADRADTSWVDNIRFVHPSHFFTDDPLLWRNKQQLCNM